MANINISWTALAGSVTDVESIEVWRSTSVTTEAGFEASLNDTKSGLTSVATGLSATSDGGVDESGIPDTDVTTGTYYYCVAAKNDGGYTVGNGAAAGEAVATITIS